MQPADESLGFSKVSAGAVPSLVAPCCPPQNFSPLALSCPCRVRAAVPRRGRSSPEHGGAPCSWPRLCGEQNCPGVLPPVTAQRCPGRYLRTPRTREAASSSCPLPHLPPGLTWVGWERCSEPSWGQGLTLGGGSSTAHGTVPVPVGRAFQAAFPRRVARFSSVNHLSIHFPKNFGAETTKIFYIGLKGEWTEVGVGRAGLGSGCEGGALMGPLV